MIEIDKLCFNCFHKKETAGACPNCGYDNLMNASKYPGAIKEGSILNGQFIVGRVLGQGGFGITYLALDYQLEIKVAIKEYLPEGMAARLPGTTLISVYEGEKQDFFHYGAERFLDEARVLAKFLGNRNIVSVKSYFKENNTAYFVMDYIEGINFKKYIKNQGGKIGYQDALHVLMPVMDALALVHREGVIHRDVTPDNIYITKDNEIKLLDFGSARYSLGDKSKSLDVILKAGYAPKEQYIRKGKQGPYTDVYSLAACFYASITGFLPPEALERLDHDEILSISSREIQIPRQMEAAIMKGLAVRAEERFQTMEEFKATILSAPEYYPQDGVRQINHPVEIAPIPSPVINPVPVPTPIINPVPVPTPIINPTPVPTPIINPAPVSTPIINPAPVNIAPVITPIATSPVYTSNNTANNSNSDSFKKPYTSQVIVPIIPEINNTIGNQAVTHNSVESPVAKEINPIKPLPKQKDKRKGAFINKRSIALLSVACILVLFIAGGIIALTLNKDNSTDSTASGGGGIVNNAVDNSNKIQTPTVKLNQSIELVLDYKLKDYNSNIKDITKNLMIPIEIKQASSAEEFAQLTKGNYEANERSISLGYLSDDFIKTATDNGVKVEKSSIIDGAYYVVTNVEDTVIVDLINVLKPAEEVVAKDVAAKEAEEKAAADKAVKKEAAKKEAEKKEAAKKEAERKEATKKEAERKEAANKAAEKEEAEKKAVAKKEAEKKAAADKAAAQKAAAEKAAEKCSYCKGTGKVNCTWCDGTGKCKIAHWNESGTEYIYKGNPCPRKITCPRCNGTGKKSK